MSGRSLIDNRKGGALDFRCLKLWEEPVRYGCRDIKYTCNCKREIFQHLQCCAWGDGRI